MGIHGTGQTYFICWEGATDDRSGPFVLPLQLANSNSAFSCLPSEVMPLMNRVKCSERLTTQKITTQSSCHITGTQKNKTCYGLPSSLQQALKDALSVTAKESIKMIAKTEERIDDIIVEALDSISTPSHHPSSESRNSKMNRSKSLFLSHQQISKRLLRQCSSWAQLDDMKKNRDQGQGKDGE